MPVRWKDVTFRQLNLGVINPTAEFTSHQTQHQHKDLASVNVCTSKRTGFVQVVYPSVNNKAGMSQTVYYTRVSIQYIGMSVPYHHASWL